MSSHALSLFRGVEVILDVPHSITHVVFPLLTVTIFPSLYYVQTFPPVEGTLGSATVLLAKYI